MVDREPAAIDTSVLSEEDRARLRAIGESMPLETRETIREMGRRAGTANNAVLNRAVAVEQFVTAVENEGREPTGGLSE